MFSKEITKNKNVVPDRLYERLPDHHGYPQLCKFLEELDNQISMKKQPTTVCKDDVFGAVQAMIQNILDQMALLDPLMKVKDFHPVGSYMEGTKVGTPNEFDFVAEIARFQYDENIICIDECGDQGTVHVMVSDTDADQMESLIYSTAGIVKYLSPVKFRIHFFELITAAATYISGQRVKVTRDSGSLTLVPDIKQFLDVFHSGPNIELHMVWTCENGQTKLALSTDITPAIRVFRQIPEALGLDLTRLNKACVSTCLTHSDVFLIPTFNKDCKNAKVMTDYESFLCWKLSFSVIETKLLRDMHPRHKLCLRILKYLKSVQKDARQKMQELGLNLEHDAYTSTMIALAHSEEEMHLLTTYMLKMAVLDHNDVCTEESSARCIIQIVRLLQRRVRTNFLPHYLLPGKSCWRRGPVWLLEDSMELVCRFLREVMDDKNYSFDKYYEKFSVLQEFVTSRDGC